MSIKNELRQRLKKDQVWQTYQHIANAAWSSTYDDFWVEALRLHKLRPVRNLTASAGSKKIIDAALSDQATRSRCVEMLLDLTKQEALLEQAQYNLEQHILSRYNQLFVENGIRAKGDRIAAINSLTDPVRTAVSKLSALTAALDRIVDDIDKGAWTIKHCSDMIQLRTKREWSPS